MDQGQRRAAGLTTVARCAIAALLVAGVVSACGGTHGGTRPSAAELVVPPSGGSVEVGYLMAPSQRFATLATTSVCKKGKAKVEVTSVEPRDARGGLEVSDFGVRRVREGESLSVVEPRRLDAILPGGTMRTVERVCGDDGQVSRLLIEVSRPDAQLAQAGSFRLHYRSAGRTGSVDVDFGVKLCPKTSAEAECE